MRRHEQSEEALRAQLREQEDTVAGLREELGRLRAARQRSTEAATSRASALQHELTQVRLAWGYCGAPSPHLGVVSGH